MLKKAAAERWCRAVNNDGRFGRWTYQLCFGAAELKSDARFATLQLRQSHNAELDAQLSLLTSKHHAAAT